MSWRYGPGPLKLRAVLGPFLRMSSDTLGDPETNSLPPTLPLAGRRAFLAAATLILLLAAMLRLVHLQDIPPGLARDETLNADIAAAILDGQHALFFRQGYGHEPLYHYLAAGLRPLLGDNWLAIRLLSVYLGLLLVAATMGWLRRSGAGRRAWLVALVAGLLLAISWLPIIFSRIGLRPILLPLLLVAAAGCWFRRPLLAGLFLGLATYSYTAGRVVFLIPILYLVYLLIFRRRLQVAHSDYARPILILVIALLIYLPQGLVLRSDPTLQERVWQLSGPLDALRDGDLRPIVETTVATLGAFAITGDPLWSYGIAGQPLFDLFTGLLFLAGVGLALWESQRQPLYGLALSWLVAALLPSAAAPDAPSMIRLTGAIPVFYLMPALSLDWLAGRVLDRRPTIRPAGRPRSFRQLVLIGLAVVVLLNLGRTLQNGFVEWPVAGETRLKWQSIWLDVGRHWRERHPTAKAESLVVADSWYEPVKADSLYRDYGERLPARWVQQGNAVIYPADRPAIFYVPEYAPASPDLLAVAGLAEPVFRSGNFPSMAVYDLPSEPAVIPFSTAVPFGRTGADQPLLTMLGMTPVPTPDNTKWVLVSYWQVVQPLPWDLAIFVHVLDPAGSSVLSQSDGLDAVPTTLRPGDTFLQRHELVRPAVPGPYTLQIGVYTRQDGQRLLQPDEPGDRLLLPEEWLPEESS
jgi:hypothetical protein